jgi:hypothetical protein
LQGWQSLQETAEALALEVEVVEKEEKINGIVTTATADWASDLAPAVTVMPVVPVVVVPVVVVQGTKTTLTGNHETTIDGVAVATTTTTIKDVAERHNHPQHQERTAGGTYKRKQGTAK